MKSKRRLRPLLGTFVEIGIRHDAVDGNAAINRAFEGIALIQSLMSFHDPASDLSRLNNSPGEEMELHPLTVTVLQLALDAGRRDDVKLSGRRARLLKPVRITLDGIAKGFAVDYAVALLKQSGITAGWINAGGDLRVFGDMTLPVCRRERDGTIRPVGRLRDMAMATSSVLPGSSPDFPGWIVHPACGEACRGTWSVLAKTAWRADALTKVAALVPSRLRQAEITRLGGQLLQ